MADEQRTPRELPSHLVGISLNRPTLDSLKQFVYLGPAKDYEDDIQEIIDQIWLFEDLTPNEIALLCEQMDCYAAKRGETILREGDSGDFLLIILTGEVSVIKEEHLKAPKLITTVGPGASLGEMSLIDGQPRFANCIAREPTDFAVLTRENLYDILTFNPVLGNKVVLMLLQILSRRLRETSEKLLPFISGIPV